MKNEEEEKKGGKEVKEPSGRREVRAEGDKEDSKWGETEWTEGEEAGWGIHGETDEEGEEKEQGTDDAERMVAGCQARQAKDAKKSRKEREGVG